MLTSPACNRPTRPVLQGRGSANGSPYRGRVFLGCDGHPITFEVRLPPAAAAAPLLLLPCPLRCSSRLLAVPLLHRNCCRCRSALLLSPMRRSIASLLLASNSHSPPSLAQLCLRRRT